MGVCPMLTLDQLRKLDPSLKGCEDRHLEELRTALYDVAQLAFDKWWAERSSKKPVGLFSHGKDKDSIKLWKNDRKQG